MTRFVMACLVLTALGCGGSNRGELETLRAGACQAAEARIEAQADCGVGRDRECTEADFAAIDCVRAACDALHGAITEGGE